MGNTNPGEGVAKSPELLHPEFPSRVGNATPRPSTQTYQGHQARLQSATEAKDAESNLAGACSTYPYRLKNFRHQALI